MSGLRIDIESKGYANGADVLRELRLAATPGEFVALVGPSGVGKSTLLNIVGGLDDAFQGSVRWDGRALHDAAATPARIAYLFQEPRLMPWLTAEENVALVLGDGAPHREHARRLLGTVGLAGFEDAYPQQLSGGMQRRVALGRAFAVEPELLLMDEPFQSLDAPSAAQLRDQLLALWQKMHPTVLFVTHDLREALTLADRILFLSQRPAHVVLEMTVDLPRPREMDGPEVAGRHRRLLERYPQLLTGITGATPSDNVVVLAREAQR